jgi:CubicO group peptidase (beta-lactamase class C family)
MSPRAFGHTGFTGTSLWIDPGHDAYVVLLTNRVYPDASNNSIQEVRRAVHDAVMRELTEG